MYNIENVSVLKQPIPRAEEKSKTNHAAKWLIAFACLTIIPIIYILGKLITNWIS